jgi:hypothetical protein
VSAYASGGAWHAVGEVYNTGNKRAENVTVEARFYGADGAVITSVQGVVEVGVLRRPLPPDTPVGEADTPPYDSPFHVAVFAPQPQFASFSVHVVTNAQPLHRDITRGMTLQKSTETPDGSAVTFTGVVSSNAGQTHTQVKVIVAVYGYDGRVLRVASAPLNPSTLPDDQQGSFSVTVPEASGYNPAATRFWVDGFRMVS